MGRALGGNLRKVRDGEDLHVSAHRTYHRAHLVRHTAGDSGVNLVKYERRHGLKVSHLSLEAEHDSGKFASGCAGLHRNRSTSRGTEKKPDIVPSERTGLRCRGNIRDEHGKRHLQRANHRLEVLGERRCRLLPRFCQGCGEPVVVL